MTKSLLNFYFLHLPTLSVHQFVNYRSRVSTLALVPIEVSAQVGDDYLYLSVGFSDLRGSGLPCDTTSLTDPRRLTDFSVCSAFYLLRWSSLARNWKFLGDFVGMILNIYVT